LHGERPASLLPRAVGIVFPPPLGGQGLVGRPHLIQRIACEQFTVFHHVFDRHRVVNVVERVLLEDDQIGQLAFLNTAQVLREVPPRPR